MLTVRACAVQIVLLAIVEKNHQPAARRMARRQEVFHQLQARYDTNSIVCRSVPGRNAIVVRVDKYSSLANGHSSGSLPPILLTIFRAANVDQDIGAFKVNTDAFIDESQVRYQIVENKNIGLLFLRVAVFLGGCGGLLDRVDAFEQPRADHVILVRIVGVKACCQALEILPCLCEVKAVGACLGRGRDNVVDHQQWDNQGEVYDRGDDCYWPRRKCQRISGLLGSHTLCCSS